ncbi:hypothetical protein Mrose_03346 [Calidithermus roseus]|uniref:Uncharacterized protein n=2 Tax=Calidithermus roseus TaxID=1644118 RepID=A0A399EHF4_9DEIN|nr:hypothetical protein Mrose_03346 [Calidithermus roseus]
MAMVSVGVLGMAQSVGGTARLSAYQPVFELVRMVNALAEMDKVQGLAFDRNQAAALLAKLRPLSLRENLEPAQAAALRKELEALLTPAQSAWVREWLEQQEKMARMRLAQIKSDTKPSFYMFAVPGYLGMVPELQSGKPFNPFKKGPNAARLSNLIQSLEAR